MPPLIWSGTEMSVGCGTSFLNSLSPMERGVFIVWRPRRGGLERALCLIRAQTSVLNLYYLDRPPVLGRISSNEIQGGVLCSVRFLSLSGLAPRFCYPAVHDHASRTRLRHTATQGIFRRSSGYLIPRGLAYAGGILSNLRRAGAYRSRARAVSHRDRYRLSGPRGLGSCPHREGAESPSRGEVAEPPFPCLGVCRRLLCNGRFGAFPPILLSSTRTKSSYEFVARSTSRPRTLNGSPPCARQVAPKS